MITLLIATFFSPSNDAAIGRMAGYLICIVVGVFPWLIIWDLSQMGEGCRYVILLLAIVWGGDTGAYFGGRFFGRRKLAPRMSPNKTWEGAIAGSIASQLGGFAVNWWYDSSLGPLFMICLCALFGSVFGQMGDLAESTLKRFSGFKDSGGIFPGHGGILDRADGLLFAAPVVWLILYTWQ